MHCLFEAGRVLLFTVEPRTNCKKCVKSYVCLSVEPLTNFNSRVFGNIFLLTVDPANCRVQIMAENANPQKHLSVAEMNHGKSYMKNSSYGRVKLHIFFEFSLGTALHLAWPTTAAPLCRWSVDPLGKNRAQEATAAVRAASAGMKLASFGLENCWWRGSHWGNGEIGETKKALLLNVCWLVQECSGFCYPWYIGDYKNERLYNVGSLE